MPEIGPLSDGDHTGGSRGVGGAHDRAEVPRIADFVKRHENGVLLD
jgi:hypothetical protein